MTSLLPLPRSLTRRSRSLCSILLFAGLLAPVTAATSTAMEDNPFLRPSELPYQYPRFDRIKNTHFLPAFAAGMAGQLKEVDAIAQAPAAPTFDNTLVTLEHSGQLLDRVHRTFSNLAGAHTDDALRKIEKEISPKLAAHSDSIRLNPALFARIEKLHQDRERLGLDPESKRLVERTYKDFVRAGAKLSEPDKTKLKAMNQEIAQLQTTFAQNVQKETNASALVIEDRAQLAGLPPNEIATAESAARAENKPGKFVLRLLNTSGQPALASLQNRASRERIHRASLARSNHGGEYDNRGIVARLARLRAERAALLGYPSHAAYQLEEQTAGSVANVNKLLGDLARPAVANAREEAADIQAVMDQEKAGFKLAAWDWDFYSEKVRRARHAFDAAELKPYFEFNRVLVDGVFFAATKLYGITFRERKDLPVYEPTVRVFEVFNADGAPLAIFLSDPYARPSKRGGAWNSGYMIQSGLLGTRPVYANHLNIPKPADGEPTLLTFDEAVTLFHEFGHALHGMFSAVKYPRFAGTNVPRDFVEFPSQVNEMWATWPEVLKNYARHYRTGELMPAALLDRMLAAEKFNQGFKTTEYLAASLLDQSWHQLKPQEVPGLDGVVAFEAAALKKAGMDFVPVPPRYRTTYFSHVFSGGYSAGYYSYIWSEVLDADTVEWFKQHGGLTRANGDRFREMLLSRGGSAEAMELYRAFRGAAPDVKPLLKRRGLDPVPTSGQ
ncbi:MAG: M3 family metallopeptidase [Opitutaceae bacterium]|nr:M3 family metallopeptidase [Opitutaceae bacterium]